MHFFLKQKCFLIVLFEKLEQFWSARQKQRMPQCQYGSKFVHRLFGFESY
jgi:nitrate reductase gamma subunit